MTVAIGSLLRRARREASGRSLLAGVADGCAIAAILLPIASIFAGFPRSCGSLLLVPIAATVAFARRRPTDLALARALDERFATGELLATALSVGDDDAVGRSIVAQADALAGRLADTDLAAGRPTRSLAAGGVALALSIALTGGVTPSGGRADAARDRPIVSSAADEPSVADRVTARPQAPHAGEAESTDASRATANAEATAARDAGRSPADGVGAASSPLAAAPPMPVLSSREDRSTTAGPRAVGDGASVARTGGGDVAGNGTASRASTAIDDAAIGSSADVARGAIDAGRVPAASRAIVRAFFDPGDAPR